MPVGMTVGIWGSDGGGGGVWQGLGVYQYGSSHEHKGDCYWGSVLLCLVLLASSACSIPALSRASPSSRSQLTSLHFPPPPPLLPPRLWHAGLTTTGYVQGLGCIPSAKTGRAR